MASKRILLIASGEKKTDAIKKMLFEKITPKVPASALRLHPSVDVVITKDIGDHLNL
jgi:glucosamine-6-phosphate deaminase